MIAAALLLASLSLQAQPPQGGRQGGRPGRGEGFKMPEVLADTVYAETRTAETRAPKCGTGKAGSATSVSTVCTCEGRVMRTDGTLPRGHRC